MPRYTVFQHLQSVPTPHGNSRESVRPVLCDGTPLILPDLRTAVAMAERLDECNRHGIGGIHCTNLRFTAGWLPTLEKES